MNETDRSHDIVVFGATGFVGKLLAEYLAENAPTGTRIALAGRSKEKLEKARGDLPRARATGRSSSPTPMTPTR